MHLPSPQKALTLLIALIFASGSGIGRGQSPKLPPGSHVVPALPAPAAARKMSGLLRCLFAGPPPRDLVLLGSPTADRSRAALPEIPILIQYAGSAAELERLLEVPVRAHLGDVFTATAALPHIAIAAGAPEVRAMQAAAPMFLENDSARRVSRVERVWDRSEQVPSVYRRYSGNNVIIGVIDTGIDWRHADFRDDRTGRSRILAIWDQSLAPRPGECSPERFGYGVEYRKADLDEELDAVPAGMVRTRDTNGHGTHVAGIAAGDGSAARGPSGAPAANFTGMAPAAQLLVVKVREQAREDEIADAIHYIFDQAAQRRLPAVVNLSLGTHSGAHDGTDLLERAIAQAAGPGRVVVKSAGNSGTTAGRAEYVHAEGTAAPGEQVAVQFTVPPYEQSAAAGDDYVRLDLWYQGGDSLRIEVERPDGTRVSAATGAAASHMGAAGFVGLFNAEYGPDALNGDHECLIELWDISPGFGPAPGVWTIRVSGERISESGHFDVWITGSSLGAAGRRCYFTAGAENDELVTIPGTTAAVITVGAYSSKKTFVSHDGNTYSYREATPGGLAFFSSHGTRDDAAAGLRSRMKPEICAPGFGVASALSADSPYVNALEQLPDLQHAILAGTSMSAPVVSGIVALLLEQNAAYSAGEIRELLMATARRDEFTGSVPNGRWGAGKVDAWAAAGGPRPPQAIGNLQLLPPAMLSWSAIHDDVSGLPEFVQKYRVYRRSAGAGRSGAASVAGETTAYYFEDTQPPGDTLDTSTTIYYVTAVDDFGNESAASNSAGRMLVPLRGLPGRSNHLLSLAVLPPALRHASELAAMLGYVDLVSRWAPGAQAWSSFVPGVPATDFSLRAGEAYMVSVTADTLIAVLGRPVFGKMFDLRPHIAGSAQLITVPLERSDVKTAAQLAAEIGPAVDLISRWEVRGQRWQSFVPGVPATDFALYPGMPLLVSVNRPVLWPATGQPRLVSPPAAAPQVLQAPALHDPAGAIPLLWRRN